MPFRQRRSPRLPRFDYATPGAYFLTVVTHRRRCLLGEIVAGRSVPNAAGQMVADVWSTVPARHPDTTVDAFVVMPNHIHGIICLEAGRSDDADEHARPERLALSDVVRSFKTMTTHRYAKGVRQRGWPPFEQRLWQRSYFDRVIRDDAELTAYREYIATNPLRWMLDREYPEDAR